MLGISDKRGLYYRWFSSQRLPPTQTARVFLSHCRTAQ